MNIVRWELGKMYGVKIVLESELHEIKDECGSCKNKTDVNFKESMQSTNDTMARVRSVFYKSLLEQDSFVRENSY